MIVGGWGRGVSLSALRRQSTWATVRVPSRHVVRWVGAGSGERG